MLKAIIITSIITLCIAFLLIYFAFGKNNFMYSLIFILLGILSIVAAIKYTMGKKAYGYTGFGDVFVFIFFGIISVLGTYFLYVKQLEFSLLLPAISIGCLSTAVLNLNNMRDIKNDKDSNKNTLVVKMGLQKALTYHKILLIVSFLTAITYVVMNYNNPKQLLFIFAFLPIFKHYKFILNKENLNNLNPELKKIALSTFLFALLFGIGQIL
jgi:1,4-dihydroxy-2-naphthoate octaprenyltransferase